MNSTHLLIATEYIHSGKHHIPAVSPACALSVLLTRVVFFRHASCPYNQHYTLWFLSRCVAVHSAVVICRSGRRKVQVSAGDKLIFYRLTRYLFSARYSETEKELIETAAIPGNIGNMRNDALFTIGTINCAVSDKRQPGFEIKLPEYPFFQQRH